MDKTTPSSEEAERAVLGAVLLDNQCYFQTECLAADDFYFDSHKRIYRAMLDLAEEGKPIDFVTVFEYLGQHKEIESVGGVAYVTSLTDGLPRVRSIEQYVKIVKDKATLRKLIAITETATYDAYCSGDPGEIISQTDRKLLELSTTQKSEPKKICDILPEADRQIEQDQKINSDREAVGCRTGLEVLDRMTTGYRRREVTVIAGDTSDGKSSLMRQGVIANGVDGKRQLIFSREVSRERLVLDIKTFLSGVYPKHVRDPRKMDLLERGRFKEANKLLRDWPLWIDDSRELTISDLFHKARKLIRMEKVDIVWIDYVQLVRGVGGNRTEQVESVCSGVWTLADSENIPVVALSQLNRISDAKGKKLRPTLRRLKDASKIEQDAHTLAFCYQPEDDNGNRVPVKSEIIIAKQRHGATGVIPVEFSQDELIFKER